MPHSIQLSQYHSAKAQPVSAPSEWHKSAPLPSPRAGIQPSHNPQTGPAESTPAPAPALPTSPPQQPPHPKSAKSYPPSHYPAHERPVSASPVPPAKCPPSAHHLY